jgi:hypothetical protein
MRGRGRRPSRPHAGCGSSSPVAGALRLRELDPERLRYEGSKPGPGGGGPLLLTSLALLDRLAALVPPRVHRYRHFGVP